jgi:hypothetical protein
MRNILLKSTINLCVFCGQKSSMQRIFINKFSLFTVGSVCRVKQFTTDLRNSLKDVRKSQMMPVQLTLLKLRQKQRLLCCGSRCNGKAMG